MHAADVGLRLFGSAVGVCPANRDEHEILLSLNERRYYLTTQAALR
jgi:hypothetical protein